MTPQKISSPLGLAERPKDNQPKIVDQIESRRTEELVFAFCGPLGSGVSAVANVVKELMTSYKYSVQYISVSEFISRHKPPLQENQKPADRIRWLQQHGNELRLHFGNNILAQLVIKQICTSRVKEISPEPTDDITGIKKSLRRVIIIDGLKHPDEVDLLKLVYGEMFYLFGVLCPETIRQRRLEKNKDIKPEDAVELMIRDKSEKDGHGQQLLKALYRADFFVRNVKENLKSLTAPISRFLNLILNEKDITPTIDEYAMYTAHSTSLKSGCMSRQVGACIISAQGEILSTGSNDVPKFGGGLYSIEDGENDSRCLHKFGRDCQNQKQKRQLKEDLLATIQQRIEDPNVLNIIFDALGENDKLKGIIEYCRAVHAEMDAIVSVARSGGKGLVGSIMYCTTFPCHYCARHILAAGISKVYYIEPYEKSLALDLHEDSISLEPDELTADHRKLVFIPFEGVAPKQYISLFTAAERKGKDGKLPFNDKTMAHPVAAKFLESFVEYEALVVKHLESLKELDI